MLPTKAHFPAVSTMVDSESVGLIRDVTEAGAKLLTLSFEDNNNRFDPERSVTRFLRALLMCDA